MGILELFSIPSIERLKFNSDRENINKKEQNGA